MDKQQSVSQTPEQKLCGIRHRQMLLSLRRWLPLTLAALLIVVLVWGIASIPVIRIYGTSMSPTLADGELCIALRENEYLPGDMIAFSRDGKVLTRRVIAGPGNSVSMDESGAVSVDGILLEETYLTGTALGQCNIRFPYLVPEGQYFVLGDNREQAVDSRSTVFGCVCSDEIIGKLYLRFWPFSSFCRNLYDET